jgi:uncharacterized metal-binding protein
MSEKKTDCCNGAVSLIFPCSGASNTGEICDRAARLLSKEGAGKMFCLAGIGGRIESFINATREADKVLVLDGCQQECARKTMEEAGIGKFEHIQITDIGLTKGKSPVNEENIRLVAEKGKALLNG